MTQTMEKGKPTRKLIHTAYMRDGEGKRLLLLRQTDERIFTWFIEQGESEEKSSVDGPSVEEALRLGSLNWNDFSLVNCGFRYMLPERDEHGINAYFHQMAASYGSINGVYYDEELGNNCYVQNASLDALELWKKLTRQNRL